MGNTPTASESTTGESPYSRQEFTAWLTKSCQRQHLPVTITDPTVLANVACLLREGTVKRTRVECAQ
ncbi:hypothetical protein FVO80_23310 [Mycobacterium avium subsp. hominissuis]|nr:hypothetical protein O974_26430 [Mycobacterium avium 11-0986]MBZ4537666.1 hypothetical protein [Mycobacterium avium subsp. hominissuis]MBZ4575520.1 hypothetical protein [Mycobacterium avium subsp. hominissuis]MBZ4580870.1 hypothetical protein [Mycobacterium avium subsp. hominissuis]MBZ4592714.1 hypothetical protein [Mycobacterium avium subsp. hominissuis]